MTIINNNILLVPVHLEALYLDKESVVASPLLDFARLPYFNGRFDVNPETAYLGESILSPPFSQDFILAKGVHLHWTLPDALRQSIPTRFLTSAAPGQTQFPAAPNRWLISRYQGQSDIPARQVVVESDYLFPPNDQALPLPTPISYLLPPQRSGDPPFRYMGRVRELDDYVQGGPDPGATLSRIRGRALTAVGYGDPSFAAFYPNCHSVFGFFEDLDGAQGAAPQDVAYEILGWYGDRATDFLQSEYLQNLVQYYFPHGSNAGTAEEQQDTLRATLERAFFWQPAAQATWQGAPQWVKAGPVSGALGRMFCYGRVTVFTGQAADEADQPITVAVGNTQTEALSAYLADKHGPDAALDKRQLEDQLEALHLASGLAQRQVDIGEKFQEARHSKGFDGVASGLLWTIRQSRKQAAEAGQSSSTLPRHMAHLLNQLNEAQSVMDRASFEIISLRQRIFSDWYKYLVSTHPPTVDWEEYPDIDEVKLFITREIGDLQARLLELAQLIRNRDQHQRLVDQELQQHNATLGDTAAPFVLQKMAAPRFYQPKEPVVLLAGHDGLLQAPAQHQPPTQEKPLDCALLLLETALDDGKKADLTELQKLVHQLYQASGAEACKAGQAGKNEQSGRPWNPFLLEWEVYHWAAEKDSNVAGSNPDYAQTFLQDNFIWPGAKPHSDYSQEDGPFDLVFADVDSELVDHPVAYTGRSHLSPHATDQLHQQFEAYVERRLAQDGWTVDGDVLKKPPEPGDKDKSPAGAKAPRFADIQPTRDVVIDWYKQPPEQVPASLADFIVYLLETVHPELVTNTLGQALGGFNSALLMHRQTHQLDIDDPLAFPDPEDFIGQVRQAVGVYNLRAPEPLYEFQPIRSGRLQLARLRLIDTFGQVREPAINKVVANNMMTSRTVDTETAGDKAPIVLPPRLAQPARLNLRWISAEDDDREMNAHPATTPICGWLVANNLDLSIEVYDGDGRALGYLDQNNQWQVAPGGRSDAFTTGLIANRHLRATVEQLQAYDDLQRIVETLDAALEHIEPESHAQHPELALLASRPLAVVRATISLELLGLPEIDHDWQAFREDVALRRDVQQRQTAAFERVFIPIRLGEHRLLDDGLAGYWVESAERSGEMLPTFYSPQLDKGSAAWLNSYTAANPPLYLSLSSRPRYLTMLFDPRGKLHATSGLLPTKAIDIPADQYQDALRAIQIYFLGAPILTSRGKIELLLPQEAGYQWSWSEKEGPGEWRNDQAITPATRQAGFGEQQEIREGWLVLQQQKENKNGN